MEKGTNAAPIGVFDYGIGGLTVVRTLAAALPDEHFVFLADESKINKPEDEDASRLHRTEDALRYASFVRAQGAKLIIVGCNLMSAFALRALREALDVPVIGLVEPALSALSQSITRPEETKVAVFTTEMAAHLHLFTKELSQAYPGVRVAEIGCSALPDLISAGLADTPESDRAVRDYVEQAGKDIAAALLTCTRFPLLMRSFERALPGIPILDPAQMLPQLVSEALVRCNLCAPSGSSSTSLMYTTGDVGVFGKAISEVLGSNFPFRTEKAELD